MKNKFRNYVWTIAGILLMLVVVYATTTITDTDVNTSGNVTALYFKGNGSLLTGLVFTEQDLAWNGNYSIFIGLINNASYLSTYNATYDAYKTNVSRNWTLDAYTNWNTAWLSTFNSTYAGYNSTGLIINHTLNAINQINANVSIVKNNTSPTFVNVTMGGVLYYQTSGACILTLNNSHCLNNSGQYIVG